MTFSLIDLLKGTHPEPSNSVWMKMHKRKASQIVTAIAGQELRKDMLT